MTQIIIIFGALTCLAGIVILINPEIIFGVLRAHSSRIELYVAVVVIRLVPGVLLIYQSDVSRYPVVIEIIGWLSITAAVFFTVIGHGNFCRIMDWAFSLLKPWGRAGGVLAACFGAFLVHAFV